MKYNKISTNMRISFNAEKPFGGIVLELCGNRNVNKISAAASSKIEVKYAQNSVTDTLITLGSYMPDEDGKVEINLDQPIAVSNIFLYCDSQISDITISEYKSVNLLNLYPKCIDIPLKENYYLDTVSVFTGTDGFSHYSLYVSLNGRDFDLVALKNDNRPCGENGDIYNLGGKEARVIRVYYEYNSASPESAFNNLDFTGRPSGTPITERPEINICDFKSSEFNVPITAADTVKEVYGMLNNFGGRLGLHGHLDNMVTGIPKVLNECSRFCGIGMTCEASANNPDLYDFLFESVWQLNAEDSAVPVNIENWIEQYAERRYGRKSNSSNRAWKILLNTVYKAEKNMLGQGAPECIVNARPGFGLKSASTWGNSLIGYNGELLERAEMLLSEDYDLLSDSDGYNYDLVSVRQQVLSNKALDCYNNISKAYEEKIISDFKKFSKDFLNLADEMNAVTGKNKYYSFKRYSEFVKALADGKDDFTKRVYGMSAKMLITTFGAYIMSESGLHDYSNRQWSGLIRNFYKPRWEMFFEKCLKELSGIPAKEINWFEWEWGKVRNTPLQ